MYLYATTRFMTLRFTILSSFLSTRNLQIDKNHTLSIFMLSGSIQFYFNIQSMYLLHILIHVLISYIDSCTRFMYSFVYSFHSYLVNYQNTWNKNRVREQTEVVGSSFLLFDLGRNLGDHHPPLSPFKSSLPCCLAS